MNSVPRQPVTTLSVVVPCFNEGTGLLQFNIRLTAVLKRLNISFEVLYVNDGSVDDTIDILRSLRSQDSRVGLINLSRNFGKEIALTAGIDHAQGSAVIVIDADLQDPPECIPEMIAAWRNGYDVVTMRRLDRSSDTIFKRVSAACFYRLMSYLSSVNIPENVGDFRLLSRRAVIALKKLPERNRYMKGLFAWIGFKSIELPYRRERRHVGDTKMPFLKLAGLALDGITSFSIAPLRLASAAGSLIASGALLFAIALLTRELLYDDPVGGYPALLLTVAFLGGLQLIAVGLLGEYVGRLLVESKRRPLYLIDVAELPVPARTAFEPAFRKKAAR